MGPNYRFQLLAPPGRNGSFGRSKVNEHLYYHYLSSMQRLRGKTYLKDRAIQPWQLDDEGRFAMPGDERSWHFLLLDDTHEVIGCARYLVHPSTVAFERLRISHSPLANDRLWGEKVRDAVESDLRVARKHGMSYAEAGGWALAEEWRGTRAALEILVASYALAHLWGGCLGSCQATVRHGSSSILRRIGGSHLQTAGEELPPYEDPHYGCTMELLRFDSRTPTQRFVPLINQLRAKLVGSVAVRSSRGQTWKPLTSEVGGRLGLLRVAPAYQ
jgi:hypothetical protein